MLESLRNKNILIVVAHPDDEVLGLGGTMNRLIKNFSVKTKVVILGEGITSRGDKRDRSQWKAELKKHKENIISATNSIGYQDVSIHDFPDNRFDTIPLLDIIKVVEEEKRSFKPDIIFTHHGGDLNIDHRRTFQAVITASRPTSDQITKMIITFETPSGTEWIPSSDPRCFIPNMFVEIDESNLSSKVKAMQSYDYEKRLYPHPRSPEALKIIAQNRGCTVGVKLAEAFQVIRIIDNLG